MDKRRFQQWISNQAAKGRRSPASIRDIVSLAVKQVPAEQALILELVERDPFLAPVLIGDRGGRSLSELGSGDFRTEASLSDELAWSIRVCSRNIGTLRTQLDRRVEIENMLSVVTRGGIQAAQTKHLVDQAASLTEVMLALELHACTVGSSKVRTVLDSVIAKVRDPLVQGCLSFWYTRRHESMSADAYDQHVDQSLSESETGGVFWHLLSGHLRFFVHPESVSLFSSRRLAFHVAQSHRYGLLDRYETLVAVMVYLAETDEAKLLSALAPTILRLARQLPSDVRLRNVCLRLGRLEAFVVSTEEKGLAEVRQALEVADWRRASDRLTQLPASAARNLEYWTYAAEIQAASNLLHQSIRDGLNTASLFRNLLAVESTGSEERARALSELRKEAIRMSDTSLGRNLLVAIRELRRPGEPLDNLALRALHASVVDPGSALLFTDPASQDALLDSLDLQYGASPLQRYWRAAIQKDAPDDQLINELTPSVRYDVVAAMAVARRDFPAALQAYRQLEQEAPTIGARAAAVLAQVNVMMTAGRLAEALELAVEQLSTDKPLIGSIDVVDLVMEIHDRRPKEVICRCEWPLINVLAERSLPRRLDADFVFLALEDFLIENALRKPTELATVSGRFNSSRIVRLLEQGCTLEHMETINAFSSSEQLVRERLEIISLLAEVWNHSNEDLERERQELQRRLVVRSLMLATESRRVHVDVDGLKRALPDSLPETLDHFLAIRAAGTEHTLILVRPKEGEGFSLEVNEAGYHQVFFRRAFRTVRDRYVSSDEHGLDSFLSIQIRHGTLSALLRRPFEEKNLLTKRDAATQEYRANEKWASVEDLGSEDAKAVQNTLSAMSAKIDEAIEHARRSLVQVRTEGIGSSGLFDFRFSDQEIDSIAARVESTATNEDALATILEALRSRTLQNLEMIRSALPEFFREEVLEAIDSSTAALRQIGTHTAQLVSALVSARASFETQLVTLANWFYLSEDDMLPDYSLERLVEATVALFAQNYRNYHAKVEFATVEKDGVVLRGATMRPIFNLLYTLIENAEKHGAETPRECQVTVARGESKVHIRVSNPIDATSLCLLTHERIGDLTSRVLRPGNLGAVRTEGDSGYVKLGRLVRSDLGVTDYGFSILANPDTGIYSVDLSLPEERIRAHVNSR